MKYRRTYEALKRFGFSPTKALEVIQDAKRKDRYALRWLHIVFARRHLDRC